MNLQGILIGTGILWALNALVVNPLTHHIVKKKLESPEYAHTGGDMQAAAALPDFKSLVTRSYIMVDTLVLGIAGFLLGAVMGWFFIGVSFEARGWPGMIAFIGMSIVGSGMKA